MMRMMRMMTMMTMMMSRKKIARTMGLSRMTWLAQEIQAERMLEEAVQTTRKTKKEELVAVHWSVLLSSSGVVK